MMAAKKLSSWNVCTLCCVPSYRKSLQSGPYNLRYYAENLELWLAGSRHETFISQWERSNLRWKYFYKIGSRCVIRFLLQMFFIRFWGNFQVARLLSCVIKRSFRIDGWKCGLHFSSHRWTKTKMGYLSKKLLIIKNFTMMADLENH